MLEKEYLMIFGTLENSTLSGISKTNFIHFQICVVNFISSITNYMYKLLGKIFVCLMKDHLI